MGVKTLNDGNADAKYIFHRKAGRSLIERRPVFSPDGESIAIIVENVVRVYNIQTGDCVRTLETENAVDELVGIEFPKDEDYNLYACSKNGCITTWTWENGAVLRETELAIPENSSVISFNLIDSKECFITTSKHPYDFLYLASYSTRTGELVQAYNETKPIATGLVTVSLGWCNGDRFAAISNGTKHIFLQNINQPHVRIEIANHNRFRVLSIAAHSKENAVVMSDTLGRVTVIRGNLFEFSKIARALEMILGLSPIDLEIEKRATEPWFKLKSTNLWIGRHTDKGHAEIGKKYEENLSMILVNNDLIKKERIFDKKYRISIRSREDWNLEQDDLDNTAVCYTDGSRKESTKLSGPGVYIAKPNTKRATFNLGRYASVFQVEVFAIL